MKKLILIVPILVAIFMIADIIDLISFKKYLESSDQKSW